MTRLFIHALTRNRLTRYDGPLSVQRAYTVAELCRLVAAAGVQPVWVRHEFPWKATIMHEKRV
ncbi:MAG: hypothetical protein M3R24_19165 [Chloroflexota bacterium]|nr:hypothetical protein [Chloroflexota bacterium]